MVGSGNGRCDLYTVPVTVSESPGAPAETAEAAAESPDPSPSVGVTVVHLFLKLTPLADRGQTMAALGRATESGTQVVTVAMLGHKADLAIMAVNRDAWSLRSLQTDLAAAWL